MKQLLLAFKDDLGSAQGAFYEVQFVLVPNRKLNSPSNKISSELEGCEKDTITHNTICFSTNWLFEITQSV